MNKRIVCFLLALIMVLGMVPNAAITANAFSQCATTEPAINVLLNSTFYKTPTNGKVGYSTPIAAEEESKYANGISVEDAAALLRKYVKETVDKEINDYVKVKNIDLTQYQHNALAIHIYRAGDDEGLFSAVQAGKTGNDMLDAFMATRTYDVSQPDTMQANLNQSLAEAGMYLNGSYSVNGLSYAVLDKNGDEEANAGDKVVAYVTAEGYTLPVLDDDDFLGWYVYDGKVDGTINGAPITELNSTTGTLIVAKKGDAGTNVAASYTINTAALTSMNVYNGSLTAITGTLKYNTNFKVTYESMVDGEKWIYGTGTSTEGKTLTGWINLGEHTEAEEEAPKPIATATLKTSMYVREGATIDSGLSGKTLEKGATVNIYEIKVEPTETGNKNWGKVIVDGVTGWIDLAYTTVEETLGESGEAKGQTGTIANAEEVNVRSSAGIQADNKIGTLKKGTEVTVLKTEMVGSAQWGLVKWNSSVNGYTQGWVYMYYVQLDNTPQVDTGSTSGSGTVLYTGVVTSNINLNVRKSADIYAAKVDSLPNGTKINVYETTTSRNMKWGRIGEDRWVCLTYVTLTEVEQSESSTGTGTSTTTRVQATVKTTTLDVYKNYNSNSGKVGVLAKDDVVVILERNTETTATGTRIWGRISTDEVEGWINLAYTDVKTVTSVTTGTGSITSSTTNSNGADAVIANCISVNVREAAGVSNAQITKLNNGTKVKVYDRVTKDNAPWALITWNDGANEGWVCMNYVTMSVTSGTVTEDGTINGTNSNTISATGTVNSNIALNVRAGAGLGYAKLGSLTKGTKVTVYEQVSADGMIWGRMQYGNGSGWICMSYVTVESASSTGKGVMGTIARCFAAVNVRSAPGTGNALINTIAVGTRVEVFETKTYSGQLWGRVAQGWICMDYVLLDSELPEGTILDATVPTTEATVPGETTEPDDGLNLEGAVACTVSGTVGSAALDIRNDADKDSEKVGTINAGKAVKVLGVKANGSEIWGLINQNGTQGWINLDNGAASFTGYVNTNKQPIYAAASTGSAVVKKLNVSIDAIVITKLGTNGSEVFGYIPAEGGWIPVSKVDDTKPAVKTYYEAVGTGEYTATTNVEVSARKTASSSAEEVFKIAEDVVVTIQSIVFEGSRVWGEVVAGSTVGYIDMSSTYYELTVTPKSAITVCTERDESKPLTDEEENDVTVSGQLTICMMNFDSNGNVWAQIIKNSDDTLNNKFVIVRAGNGTFNVSGLN